MNSNGVVVSNVFMNKMKCLVQSLQTVACCMISYIFKCLKYNIIMIKLFHNHYSHIGVIYILLFYMIMI